MNQRMRLRSALLPAAMALPFLLAACATAPTATSLTTGQSVTLEGAVISVDTDPWAYDGNAVVVISTASAGAVKVQLPARWNLCKAQPLDDLRALKANDRVRVTGTATAPDEVVVCQQPQDQLKKIP